MFRGRGEEDVDVGVQDVTKPLTLKVLASHVESGGGDGGANS